MPRLSDTMEQGTVVTWHVKEGDTVSQGDVLADIETDKATMELESFDNGTVAKLAAEEGQKVAVGEMILVIAEEGEDAEEAAKSASKPADGGARAAKSEGSGEDTQQSQKSESSTAVADREDEDTESDEQTGGGDDEPSEQQATEQQATDQRATDQESSGAGTAAPQPSSNGVRVFASPLARKVAAERGITLSGIQGTGPGGRITRKDVESASAAPAAPARTQREDSRPAAPIAMPAPAATLESKSVSLNNMRETIAKRLQESKSTIPHYQVTVSVRLDTLMELREQLNGQLERQGVKLSVNDFLVRACALAMHQHPFVNSSWNPGSKGGGPKIDLHGSVNIGVAVALPEERGGGLVVATIRDADRTGLRQISARPSGWRKRHARRG